MQTASRRDSESYFATFHARKRMKHRGVDQNAVEAVLDFGRVVYTRGAMVFAIGKREIEQWIDEGVNLSKLDGVQVVCSLDGAVITVYRNRNFRGLRTGLGRGKHNPTSRCTTR